MLFKLPIEITDTVFSYLNIVQRRGRYVKMLNMEEYTTLRDMFLFQQAHTTNITLMDGIMTERVLFRDNLMEIKVFHYIDYTWLNSNEMFSN
jgi:hypothetical protein